MLRTVRSAPRLFTALAVIALAATGLAACGQSADARPGAAAAGNGAAGGKFTAEEYVMGSPTAKVTVVEYLSNACVHCARFDEEVFPTVKKKYIDSGQVKWVVRELLTGPPQLAAAGFVLARCAGRDKYWPVTEAIFHAQDDIFKTGDIRGPLLKIAQSMGMSEKQFDACIQDDQAYKDLNARNDKFAKQDNVNTTPTFIINGKKYDKGEMSVAELDTAIAAAKAGK